MKRTSRTTHLVAAILFSALTLYAVYSADLTGSARWRTFSVLALAASAVAWLLFFRASRRQNTETQDACDPNLPQDFPEGQAKLIDSGRLPNRYNPRINLIEFEICHFSVPAQRLIMSPLADGWNIEQNRLAIRYSGGNFYYIVRPQEILLAAHVDDQISGELAITNQRILFLAPQDGFEVPIQSIKLLDCSAHLVDFQVRERRYTLQTDSACYAEKVLHLLLQMTGA